MHIFCFDNSNSCEIIKSAVLNLNSPVSFHVNESISSIFKIAPTDTETIFFIDTRIHSKKQNSFTLAQTLREKFPLSHIVFTSSYQEDLILCVKNLLRPSAFLLRPFSAGEVSMLLSQIFESVKKQSLQKALLVSTHEFKRRIDIDSIVYFSTSGKKLLCYTTHGERIEFYETLSNLEKRFENEFIRTHQGFLVNRQFIRGIKKGELELDGIEETIPISQKYKSDILTFLA